MEKDFADSWQAYVDKDVVVKVALLDALKDDPDADPTADATVTAAIADRDAPAVAGALATATNAYTTALADELDAWEREVPIGLWEAARDLRRITVWLDRLADPATRTDLVNTLDAATEQVAAAHDEQAVLRRATARIASELGLEAGRIDAISSSSNERELAYVRGDGRGGRHADES